MSHRTRYYVRRIPSMIAIFLGLVAFIWGLHVLQRAHSSITWPTVPGVIQDSTVRYRWQARRGRVCSAEINYDFMVNGTNFGGQNVTFDNSNSGYLHDAEAVVRRFPKGLHVTVYYNGEEPSLCVLVPGIKGRCWLVLLPGLLLVTLGALGFVQGRKE